MPSSVEPDAASGHRDERAVARPLHHRWLRLAQALAALAGAYAFAVAVSVYGSRGGAGMHRLESALLIFVALLAPLATWPRSPAPASTGDARWSRRLLLAWAAALWLTVSLPFWQLPFLSDDYVFLERYGTPAGVVAPQQFFRPVFGLVFWAVSAASGAAPWAFHVAGALLHWASGALIYRLAVTLFASRAAATIVVVVFVLNPLQLEAVLWASGLQETLWTFCAWLALTFHTRQPRITAASVAATVTAMTLSLGAKETAVCLGVLLPAADGLLYRFRRGPLMAWAYLAFAAVLVGYLVVRTQFVAWEPGFLATPSRYFLKQFVAQPYRVFAQPWNAQAVAAPAAVAIATVAVAILAAFWLLAVRRAWREAVAGAAIMLAASLPVYGYFFVSDTLAGARYLYFEAAGWGVLVASAIAAVGDERVRRLVAAALCVVLALALHLNLAQWRTAGQLVTVMEAAGRRGEPPDRRAQVWASERALDVTFSDGIPRQYRGVGIFVNGYPDFLRRLERARVGP
jgi:hypothetical protein